jgi:hypothetical protein
MPSLPVNIFCKLAQCPSSETLLAYRRAYVASGENAFVEAHLADCEFCDAELLLLDRYCYGAEEVTLAPIPAALRRLAEELLPNRSTRMVAIAEAAEHHSLSN